jgi:hypothetical protein
MLNVGKKVAVITTAVLTKTPSIKRRKSMSFALSPQQSAAKLTSRKRERERERERERILPRIHAR